MGEDRLTETLDTRGAYVRRTRLVFEFWRESLVVIIALAMMINKWLAFALIGVFVATTPLLFLLARRKNWTGAVEADAGGLTIAGGHVARAEIDAAYLLTAPPRLVVEASGLQTWEIQAVREDAARLMRAAHLDPEHAVTRIPIGAYPVGRVTLVAGALVVLFLALLLPVTILGIDLPYQLFGAVVLPLLMLQIRGRAEVGKDGVLLRWLFAKRWIPARRIESVGSGNKEVTLELGRDERVVIPIPEEVEPKTMIDLLQENIAARRDLHRIEETLLTEQARGVAHLRRLLSEGATFRTASVQRDQLWQVVESGDAEPVARAAAAVALGDLDEHERVRLRAVSETIAGPKLRVAIESCADDDEEEAARALEALSKE